MPKKILVVVLSLDKEPYNTIEKAGQQATWGANSDIVYWLRGSAYGLPRLFTRIVDKGLRQIGSKTLLYQGRHFLGAWAARRAVTHQDTQIITQVPETYINTNAKTKAGLRYSLEVFPFNYLLRTNSSTYVNLRLLASFVEDLPRVGFYGGRVGEADGIAYASGTGMLLSRDVVELIVKDPQWEYGIIDDVAVGRCMSRNGISVHPIERIDVFDDRDIQLLDRERLRSTFLVRCKGNQGRAHDINAMHRVHALYQELGLA